MRQRDLNFFRRLLESRKQEILTEAERALGTMNNKPEGACPDPTDRASLESDRTFELRMRDRERKLLAKINEAFTRIDSATYGRSEQSAPKTTLDRPKHHPFTPLSIHH